MLIASALGAAALLDRRLTRAGRSDLGSFGVDDLGFIFVLCASAVVGAALAIRRRHIVGWLFLALASVTAAIAPSSSYAVYGTLIDPAKPAPARFLAVFEDTAFVVWFVIISLILHLTPTGKALTPRWGRAAAISSTCGAVGFVIAMVSDRDLDPPYEGIQNPLALPGVGGFLAEVASPLILVGTFGLLVGAASLVLRFRRSRGVERQQLLWFAVVAIPAAVCVGASIVVAMTTNNQLALAALAGLGMALVPIGAGLAISRYHLYDIDRILSRGLTWLLVSGCARPPSMRPW